MLDITTLIPTVIARLKALAVGDCIDLRTYKRDRSVVIIRTSPDSFKVIEDGFFKDEMEADIAKMPKLLKALVKKEFPRSNKVRLYAGRYEGGQKI
jgi:hypothetical protein